MVRRLGVKMNSRQAAGDHTGAIIRVSTRRGANSRQGCFSFISPEQAELNLQTEIGDDCFRRL